jgi:hypothetical protein
MEEYKMGNRKEWIKFNEEWGNRYREEWMVVNDYLVEVTK